MSILIGKTAIEQATDFVRDMAESDPYRGEGRDKRCRYCSETQDIHHALCPWKRAKKIAWNLRLEGTP